MKRFKTPLDPQQLTAICGGNLQGGFSHVNKVSEPHEADADTVIFLEQEKLLDVAANSQAGLIITTKDFIAGLNGRTLLVVDKPYLALMVLITYWQRLENKDRAYNIHSSAVIADDIHYEGEVSIGPNVVVGSGCTLGKGVIIAEGCSIAGNVTIGAGTMLYPRVSIYEDSVIGKNCIIHSGVVIGADGFGFMLMNGIQQKIPQVGNVIIGDGVEIGANSCIDRATLGSTKIGNGTKIDDLVMIVHNCIIGEHSILCSQVGLAGSTVVGDYVYLAGQVGAAGHLTIGSRAMIGAQSGVVNNIPEDARYFGSPAMDANLTKRIMATQKHLPDMYRAFMKARKEDS